MLFSPIHHSDRLAGSPAGAEHSRPPQAGSRMADELFAVRRGATDSELLFLLALARIDRGEPPGDAMHAVLCATGYNLRWLLRAMIRLGLTAFYLRPLLLALSSAVSGIESRGRAYYAPTFTFQAV